MNSRWIGVCCIGIVSLLVASIASGIATTSERQDGAAPLQDSDQPLKAKSMDLVKNPDAFIMATIGEPQYLDPAVDYETAGGEILQNTYETLVWYSGSSASALVPKLATAVPTVGNGITADGLYYNFTLKSNVKFHNNVTMTADDVAYSAQRAIRMLTDGMSWYIGDSLGNWESSVTSHTIPAWLLATVGGTDPNYIITELDNQNASEAAVRVIDSTHVSFHLTHAYPGFLQICAYTVVDVVSKAFVEAHGGVVNGQQNTQMNYLECGTGPYYLASWDIGVQIHMIRWSGYWGPTPALKDVYIVKANDQNTRILMLQAGDADSAVVSIDDESLFSNSSYRVVKGLPTFDLAFAGFNLNIDTTAASTYGSNVPSSFFQDRHVRTAFAHLLNYTQFINDVFSGNAIIPNGPIPNGMFGYDSSVPAYNYSLALAEAQLKLAPSDTPGQSWWDKGFTIAFMFNAGNGARQAACMYMKAALESLGSQFHATINALDWPTYLANLYSSPSPFPLFYLGWAPDFADPDDYCNPLLLTGGTFPYTTGYSNATIDALVIQASSELNTTLRMSLYRQISWLVYNDTPYIWLYQSNNFHIERSWISGYYYNPMYAGLYYAALSKVANTPPVPDFQVTPSTGDTSTLFTFDASASHDAEDGSSVLVVQWDWNGDGTWDTTPSTNKVATHTFASAGDYNVSVNVIDTGGLNATLNQAVIVTSLAIPEFGGSMALVVAAAMALMIAISWKGRRK
jgi:peptide/nickel transport system substrate-binding protein